MKVDFKVRQSENVIHKLDQNISKPTSGMTTIEFRPKADYNLSRNLTSQLFFNYRKTIPATSASYPNKQIEGGIRLRYTLRP